jgi:hypothetical protein
VTQVLNSADWIPAFAGMTEGVGDERKKRHSRNNKKILIHN